MVQSRPIEISVEKGKAIYFCSDQHFGAPNEKESKKREALFIQWLTEIEKDAHSIFILGDLFDFWFEYKKVVPKGFIRVLGKLANMSDQGIKFYFFTGNHDLWMRDYLEKELSFSVFREKQEFIINGKNFFLAHGDGLGPEDNGYKRMKKLFKNPIAIGLYRWLHPDIGIKLGNYLSRSNKMISGTEDKKFLGEESEWLVQYAKKKLEEKTYDYFIFGHRHLPLEIKISQNSYYINLGDWIVDFTYAELKENKLALKKFNSEV